MTTHLGTSYLEAVQDRQHLAEVSFRATRVMQLLLNSANESGMFFLGFWELVQEE